MYFFLGALGVNLKLYFAVTYIVDFCFSAESTKYKYLPNMSVIQYVQGFVVHTRQDCVKFKDFSRTS